MSGKSAISPFEFCTKTYTRDIFVQVVAGAVCVGSLYWTGVTFGAVTVMQAIGHDEGLMLMEKSDPLFLLVSLPLVPVGLVMGKMIRWEEPVSFVVSIQ